MKTTMLLLSLLAIAGTALAGADVDLALEANGETHTLAVSVGDDGSASVLVDGQPVGAPEVPTLP